jgi:hypothetical protein
MIYKPQLGWTGKKKAILVLLVQRIINAAWRWMVSQ